MPGRAKPSTTAEGVPASSSYGRVVVRRRLSTIAVTATVAASKANTSQPPRLDPMAERAAKKTMAATRIATKVRTASPRRPERMAYLSCA